MGALPEEQEGSPPSEPPPTTSAEPSPDEKPSMSTAEDREGDELSLNNILGDLSDEEKETAARFTYRYLVASSSGPDKPSDEERDRHAKKMIHRYLRVEQKLHKNNSREEWEKEALAKMKKSLEFRVQNNVDEIRLCFDADKRAPPASEAGEEPAEKDMYAIMREGLTGRYSNGASIVRGYAKDDRALFVSFPRTETAWEEDFYIKGNIYMLERAMACTERRTNGEKSKVYVLYDYNGYGMKNSPPTSLVRRLLFNLRDHWPECLQHVYVVDAPFIFRAFWSIIKHFIDPITKELVQFVTGEEAKQEVFGKLVSEDQAMPFMLATGKNVGDADMNKFLYDIPFDRVYGEET